jgi:hypothetical protein
VEVSTAQRKEEDYPMMTYLVTVGRVTVFVLALLSSTLAWAGARFTPEVVLGPTFAYGSVAGARYSSDALQYIGCIQVHDSFSGFFAACYAADRFGGLFSCFTVNPNKQAVIQSISEFSILNIFSTAGECTYISVDNNSFWIP